MNDARFLAVDLELDGLRDNAHLLQAGWLPFASSGISLESANSCDIRSDATLDSDAVTIHGIGEQRAASGEPLADVLTKVLLAAGGRIIVAHGANIDTAALQSASRKLWGVKLPTRSICTLALERHLSPHLIGTDAYRLGPTRSRYGLPEYAAHDALSDALAAAELFLAQLTRLPADTRLSRLERLR
ncbi:3'-5' exonuclease [Aurantiacibacter sp. MUD61]|uniref:3'-5' exonuclease n=1 Tax=Aurantiacibacter sp. MUD61 TaxID=3009083 RepID=UPI0022F03D55|nr:3'-5' exonuclease [Aurantiacibacter sp. MUD61]